MTAADPSAEPTESPKRRFSLPRIHRRVRPWIRRRWLRWTVRTLLAIFVSPWFLLAYLIDAPAIMLPVLRMALSRHEFWKAFASIPSFFVLRTVNGFFMLRAIWDEWVVRKRLTVYEKGH